MSTDNLLNNFNKTCKVGMMNRLWTKRQQRKTDAFFRATVDHVFASSSITFNVDRDFLSFYNIVEQYLEKWFNFSETGHLYSVEYFNLKENWEINYQHLTTVVSALWLEAALDMDELYNETCGLKEVLRHLEPHNHPIRELWAQALKSRSAFPQYVKLLSFVLRVPVSNAYYGRVNSIMKCAWTNVRNRCSFNLVCREINRPSAIIGSYEVG